MPALSDQVHTVRFPLPHEAVVGEAVVWKAPLYLDAALVTATSATISVYDESGTAVVSAAPATPVSNIASYSASGSLFASAEVNRTFRAVWTIVHAGGTVVAENDGIVVLRRLYPVITSMDIHRRISALNSSNSYAITARTSMQDSIDEAWAELIGDLLQVGFRAGWVRSPSSLRKAHLELSLAHVFADLASQLQPAYAELAKEHRAAYRAAFGEITVRTDKDGDGAVDRPAERTGAAPGTIWTGARV